MPPGGKRAKYLGYVAHEIKNPLTTALWSCDLLKRVEPGERGNEKSEKMIDASLRALRRMKRLIDDFFTLERLQEGGYELKHERLAMRELIDPALEQLKEREGVATAGWTVAAEGEVACDPEMTRRALRLAIEHMARSPQPRVDIEAAGGVIRIRAETPPTPLIPPPPEERPSGDPQGAVLGFALAAQILASQGGRIEERDGALALVFNDPS
jgi:signal transduction histidine kinase